MTPNDKPNEKASGREPTLQPSGNVVPKRDSGPPAFKVYGMPPEVFSRFITYTKQYAGNKAWVAINQLLTYANLAQRLGSIEERLTQLEGENKNGSI